MSGPAWAESIPRPRDPLPGPAEAFLDYLRVQRNHPPTTVRAYRQGLGKFVAFTRNAAPDQRVRDFFRRYQMELAELLPNPRSRARELTVLRVYLRWAFREEVLRVDWSGLIVVPRFSLGDPHPIPTEAIPRLLAALPRVTLLDQRDRALVHFLISTGCRVSEAVAVNRDQIAPDGFRVLGKGSKHRTVYLTAAAWEAVTEYLEARGEDGEPALFMNFWRPSQARGRGIAPKRRLTADGVRAALREIPARAMDPAALAPLSHPHALRHTAATTLLEATGGDVRLVQEVLGHATLATLRVYTEITDRQKRAAYDRLGDYLRAAGPQP